MAANTIKVALVTGASSGIGEAAAKRLIDAGFAVYAGARRLDRMAALASRGAILLPLDLTEDASIVAAVERIRAERGRLDVLLNNAGYGSYGAVEDVPIAEGRRQFEVNLFGLARLIQLVTPMMRAQHAGRIINISSMGGKIWEPLGAWYHATKFAVEGFSDCLRMELTPFGVDVVVIEPGAINTEWGEIALDTLARTSGQTAYAPQAEEKRAMFLSAAGTGSDPDVVAQAVIAAVNAQRPKTRYAVGAFAKPMIFAVTYLPNRAFDWIMNRIARRSLAGQREAGRA
jgi:NAD(P)-dependent dehydrogenase (short-subunit alcohol dehydrogenase family)